MDPVRLYLKMVAIKIRGQMAYKTSFIFMSLGHFLITVIEFFGMYALFLKFDQIKGWTLYEVAVFYGFINVAFAIAEMVGRGYDVFDRHVRLGSFDRFLLRPRNINLQIISSEFQLMRVGRLFQGLLVLLWGLKALSIKMDLGHVLMMLYALVCAVLFFVGLMIFQATLSFWSIESLEIINAFTYGGVQTAQYPIDIYKDWFKKVFVYLIPIGSVSYYPLRVILRDANNTMGLIMPLLGVLFFVLGLMAFRVGTSYYCSTGS